MLNTINKASSISDVAKEVFQIEADSILKLKERLNSNIEKAVSRNSNRAHSHFFVLQYNKINIKRLI